MIQDDKGFFWIGTEEGLNRFDGYSFNVYKKQPADSLSLISSHITALFQDSRGRIWIGTVAGPEYYEPSSDGFVNVSLNQPDEVAKQSQCADIMEDSRGRLWFALSGSGVLCYSPLEGESVLFTPSGEEPSICSPDILTIAEDRDGQVWFGSGDSGISVYNPETGSFRNYNTSNSGLPGNTILDLRLLRNGNMLVATHGGGAAIFDASKQAFMSYTDVFNSPYTRSVFSTVEDEKGNILIGTEGKGVFVFDPLKRELRTYPILEDFSHIFGDANISCLYIGGHGYLWAGVKYKGVFVVGNELSAFHTISKVSGSANSLNYNYVTGIATDRDKDIWIATNGGGLNRYRHSTGSFTHYTYRKDDPGSLSDNSALCVFCDSRNRIWAGTYMGGLCLFDREKESFTQLDFYDDGRPGEPVKTIQEDKQGILWLGTLGGGVVRFDPAEKTFRAMGVKPKGDAGIERLIGYDISILFTDSRNRLWIGTNAGLGCMDIASETFRAYVQGSGLGSLSVYSIAESAGGVIWVGTADGLYKYIPAGAGQEAFSRVFPASGKETTVVNGLVYAGDLLWLSTNRGAVSYSIPDGVVKTYSRSNSGIGNDEFLQGSYYKSPAGEVFFGSTTGLSAFFPHEVQDSVTIQKVYITGLSISNEPVYINREINGRVVLDRNISETSEITLRYSDKNFRLDFLAMGSYKTYSTVYAWKLEGFDKDWTVHDYTTRNVTYTNLNPGTYVFRVKASSDPNVLGDEETSLVIHVEPPLWNTWWARLLYILLSIGVIYAAFRITLVQVREKNKLNIERIRVKQQEELNHVRTGFFTNISHEFRTPLTLIIGPLRRILSEDIDEGRKKTGMLILRNAERLQRLINQILDLNKIEDGKIKLHVEAIDLVSFISCSVSIFNELMHQKNISLTYTFAPDNIEVWYDPDMLDKCLNNIMYNAFKFTPAGGEIHIDVRVKDNLDVLVSISDTGVGMSRETTEHLFDRFFQGHASREFTGTGIGMHLTKTIVDLHKGDISVESREGGGSCFYFIIRHGNEHFAAGELVEKEEGAPAPGDDDVQAAEEELSPALPGPAAGGEDKIVLLLVEDNEDMRFYIRQELSRYNYVIEEAADGRAGLDMARRLMPDLIVADFMMPLMSGAELCRILKSTPETSHIPIIILTAQDDMQHRLEGVESGADSFIAKPFSTRYLQVRIEKLIELRRKMKERFSKSIYMDTQELTLTSMDERLLQKAIDYVGSNMENPEFSVEQMSRHLGMSRVHLHRKLKALTGKSPVEFIRMIRMKQAARLITTGKLSISDVAYRVGYNAPSYFSSTFSAYFGMSPTAYMEKYMHSSPPPPAAGGD
jgi:signal transduction histidine kinase/ligand-binding sensor domain-containing protein/DNA-binding response OmpR family regulator